MKGSYPFLPGLLQWIFLGGVRDATPLEEYTFEQTKLLRIPEESEPDSGPADVWKWSHLEMDSEQFVWIAHCRELRAWGYVMWNNARLDKSDIHSQPFTLPLPPDEEELERRKDVTVPSMVKRRKLFREGAKGWWAEGDESHLKLGKQIKDDNPCLINIHSPVSRDSQSTPQPR